MCKQSKELINFFASAGRCLAAYRKAGFHHM